MSDLAVDRTELDQSVPVRTGLFSLTDPPRLLVGRCDACGRYHFPRSPVCPYCAGTTVSEEELAGAGTLWAWTAVTAPPPGYRGQVPYGFGVVELPEELRVIGRLTEPDPSALVAGQPMGLVLVPLHHDDEGRTVVTYAFAPGPGSGSSS